MLRYVLTLLAFIALGAAPAFAQESPRPWRINNIPLDMPLEADLNGEYLEGIYQEKLMGRLIDSVLSEWPSYHIRSTLRSPGKVGGTGEAEDPGHERMELYFSSAADQRRLFWIRANRPLDGAGGTEGIANALAMIEQGFAKPDRVITDPERPGSAILIMVDRALAPADQDRLRASLRDPLTLSAAEFGDFWAMDLQARARILGPGFRGAIAILNAYQGKLLSLQLELLDLNRAQTVFNLTP